MKYNDIIFKKSIHELYKFIIYREDLKIFVIEPLYAHNSIIPLLLYEEIKEENFFEDFSSTYSSTIQFLQEKKETEISNVSKSCQRKLKKLEKLKFQLECMKKHNASIEHIKSWERAIRRENKKIERAINKRNKELNEIELKYKKTLEYLDFYKEKYNENNFFDN